MAKMLHCRFLLLRLVLCLVLVVDSENHKLVVSDKEVTWLEGQRLCAEKSGRLLGSDDFSSHLQEALDKFSKNDGDFWLGDVQKVSEWIHILGCYNKASIENFLSPPTNFTIKLTPGRCQEFCLNEKKSLFFAIMEETCYCLNPDFSSRNTSSETSCDYNCNLVESKTCGQFLSVYKTTNTSDKGKNSLCMSIECSGVQSYKPENCTKSLTPYCSNNYTGTGRNWTDANAMCLMENGYLDGEANLNDPTNKCNEIKTRFPNTFVFWIGIRRQVYRTMDKGYPTELNSLKECEFFSNGSSTTMQTNNCRKKKYAVCLVPKNASVNSGNQPAQEEGENNDDTGPGPIVGGVFGGVFLIASVFLLSIVVIRRHRQGNKEDQSTLKFESEKPTAVSEIKVHQQHDNGLIRNSEVNGIDIKEETYYKSQDEYDILGKRRSKIKGTPSENIYNQTEKTTNQNFYASAAQVSRRISGEDLYDHTNKSEYGTVLEIENENMYSQS